MRLFRIGILLLLITQLYSSQSFQSLTVRDGLSDNQCTSLTEDGYGFIWVGTNEGLNRYDGYTPRIYRSNPFDSTALSGNRIFGHIKTSQGGHALTNKLLITFFNRPISFKRNIIDLNTSSFFLYFF